MVRQLMVCACALVAVLLLCSDASACGKRRGHRGYGGCYGGNVVYSGGCYGGSYGGYAGHASATYATSAAPSYASAPGYGYSSGSGYAPTYGYGYGRGYDIGRPGYNPGGLGGPRSGLGVRPGPGFGGLGPRR
jgi:hypothetical protein